MARQRRKNSTTNHTNHKKSSRRHGARSRQGSFVWFVVKIDSACGAQSATPHPSACGCHLLPQGEKDERYRLHHPRMSIGPGAGHPRFTIRLHDVLAAIGSTRAVSGSRSLRTAFGAKAALAGALLSLLAGPALADGMTEAKFASYMDTVFGRGAWRMTGGYRTPEREDQLRAQGAMTVRPGGLSRHSLGRPGAPGAFDLVVDGMSPGEAANRLRVAGAPFARYQPKGSHGTQGPHLHLEPYGFGPAPSAPRFQMVSSGASKDPVEERRATAVTIAMPASSAGSLVAARDSLNRLRASALQHNAEAQLELGQAYAQGYIVPRDFAEAQSWLAAAVDNDDAEPETQAQAEAALAQVNAFIEAERAQQPTRYAKLKTSPADR
jgi:hypothetical protein